MYFNPLLFLLPAWAAAQTTTITSCHTDLISIQLPFVSTAVNTTTTAQVYFVTVTAPVITTTVPQQTITTTSTVVATATVTAPPNTDVFFTTSTAVATATTTITTTRTSTVVVWLQSTSTTTTTIPPPIGFLNVVDTTATAYPANRAARRRYALPAEGLEAVEDTSLEKRQTDLNLNPLLPVGVGVGLFNGYVQCKRSTPQLLVHGKLTAQAPKPSSSGTRTP
ncbi:uncharacterized protein K452DRAFT_284665 [Aplosporella prunicola CBS 121167]|uniref:Uncharacterized protein n=1 Tax=Aplosporella prunicola CBS 121167 TaxID=1176127 RepID=A0A6A6BNN8_9PEZI|nr:uncharacterized protein K452DRAFT_284665 [Aplosporella prunicola CBS 121167]KAF2145288.1 hypothetical protein K452DRAFT_284665 [Aplosporella prunicola CBS 121167]